MRLALVISSLAAGGAERVLATLANMWLQRGTDVVVLTDAAESLDHYQLSARVKRIALHLQSDSTRLRDKVGRNIFRVHRLRKAIRAITPHAVIAFGDTMNARVLLSCFATATPIVVSERTDPRQHVLPWPWRLLRRLLYPFAACVVVQTESVAQWGRSHGSVRTGARNSQSCSSSAFTSRTASNSQHSPHRGRHWTAWHREGFRFAREEVGQLLFQIGAAACDSWTRSERPALQAQIDALGLTNNVLMPGIVAEPEQWLQHADLFVLPSRYEGFPNALLEAMNCGLPVIAFDCPSGPGEIVRNEQTGVLLPPGDTDALATAITRLALDPALRRRLGSAAALDVAQRFNLNRIAELWDNALSSVMIEARPKPL